MHPGQVTRERRAFLFFSLSVLAAPALAFDGGTSELPEQFGLTADGSVARPETPVLPDLRFSGTRYIRPGTAQRPAALRESPAAAARPAPWTDRGGTEESLSLPGGMRAPYARVPVPRVAPRAEGEAPARRAPPLWMFAYAMAGLTCFCCASVAAGVQERSVFQPEDDEAVEPTADALAPPQHGFRSA